LPGPWDSTQRLPDLAGFWERRRISEGINGKNKNKGDRFKGRKRGRDERVGRDGEGKNKLGHG